MKIGSNFLPSQLFPASLRDRVELRLAVALRGAPLRRHPALLHQAQQRVVDGAFVQPQSIVANLLEATRDVPVQPVRDGSQQENDRRGGPGPGRRPVENNRHQGNRRDPKPGQGGGNVEFRVHGSILASG